MPIFPLFLGFCPLPWRAFPSSYDDAYYYDALYNLKSEHPSVVTEVLNHTDTLVCVLSAERNLRMSRSKVGATSEGKVTAPKEGAAEAADSAQNLVSMMETMMKNVEKTMLNKF